MSRPKRHTGVLTPSRVASECTRLLAEFQQYNSVLLYVIRERSRNRLQGDAAEPALAQLRSYTMVLDEWRQGLSQDEKRVTSFQVSGASLVALVSRTKDFYSTHYLPLATTACATEVHTEEFNAAMSLLFGTFDSTGAYAIVENLLQAIIDHAQVLARVGVAIQKLNDFTTRST